MNDGRAKKSGNGSYVVRAGCVRTLQSPSKSAVGFLVRDGRINKVFKATDTLDDFLSSFEGRVRDYGDCTVLPGFADAHTHMHSFGKYLGEVDLEGVKNFRQVRERIRSYMDQFENKEWILGRGWNPNLMEPDRWPHRNDLEELDVDKPIALQSHDQHSYWLNRVALKTIGIDSNTESPAGGEIVTEVDGTPTGVLKEEAMKFVDSYLEENVEESGTSGKEKKALLRAVQEAFRSGVTAVHDIGSLETYRLYETLQAEGTPFPRVTYFCTRGTWEEVESSGLSPGTGDDLLTFAGLKLFSDGTLGGQTAAMLEPYSEQLDRETSRGTLIHSPEELTDWTRRAAERGFPVAIHAIGDRGVRLSLDAFESAIEEFGENVYGHRVEHAQMIHPDDLSRFHELDVVASLQPCHIYQDRDVADRVWKTRESKPFPVRSLLDSNSRVYLGTDVPIEEIDPLRNLQATVHRGLPEEDPWYPEESITIEEALRHCCREPRKYMNSGSAVGTLQEYAPADFVVLSSDPVANENSLLDIDVRETVLGGVRVYSAGK